MTNGNKLFCWQDPYDLEGTAELFAAAMEENARFQAARCPDYARILSGQAGADLSDPVCLPPIPTLYFKRHALFSLPEKKLLIKATSSGTSGAMSHMAFDAGSLLRGLSMVWRMTRYHRLLSPVPCPYLSLGYQPRRGNDPPAHYDLPELLRQSQHRLRFRRRGIPRRADVRVCGDLREEVRRCRRLTQKGEKP